MTLATRPYEHGLLDLGNGGYAWLQPDGGWGWSNAGLIVDGDQSLIVDTLFDKPLTADMLKAMRASEPKATAEFDFLINTHANADHCNGNELVAEAEIIASQACFDELARENPNLLQTLMEQAPSMGEVGEFFLYCFSDFDFRGINRTLPTRTFEDEMTLTVGDKTVCLKQVGPAHTAGDILAYVPDDKLIFTGDILFIEGHPIIWEGPISNWIDACDHMLALDLECVVPGHGPVTDKQGVTAMRDYLQYVAEEARKRFDAGLGVMEAARDIALTDYDSWGDAERIVVNVATLYKEFANDAEPNNITELFALMAALHKERRR
ncbi:MAG: MBL fold metallo-hydrolase [Gammaproteobacteria bacterium]|nr:MBL fold metallo-hydrolase [Gammaproteobacteria bacterium]